jgi:hypothetical protein
MLPNIIFISATTPRAEIYILWVGIFLAISLFDFASSRNYTRTHLDIFSNVANSIAVPGICDEVS